MIAPILTNLSYQSRKTFMSAAILEGHALADHLLANTRLAADAIAARTARKPILAILLMGNNPGALAYVSRLEEFAERASVTTQLCRLEMDASQNDVVATLRSLGADDGVDGVLPLLPLPAHVDPLAIAQAIDPAKDVDGLSPLNAGRLALGLEGLEPCAPLGAIKLAESVAGDLKGVTTTVVGASISVGRPLALMLLRRQATVTVAHIATRDLAAACRCSDLLFVAAGKPGLITADHVKPGAIIIDIGVNIVSAPENGPGAKRIVGDVDIASAGAVAKIISAAPDGVGPLTTAHLMANTVRAAQMR
jgi:methylenetetrahydrofolate dehydrogenase (NADP+)/methenyltetrahydrofolate cyclohydrolase